jgi:hypothetical protein
MRLHRLVTGATHQDKAGRPSRDNLHNDDPPFLCAPVTYPSTSLLDIGVFLSLGKTNLMVA